MEPNFGIQNNTNLNQLNTNQISQNSNRSSVHRISIIKTDGQKEIILSQTNQAHMYNNPQIIKETKII